jgi:hypothetical protein
MDSMIFRVSCPQVGCRANGFYDIQSFLSTNHVFLKSKRTVQKGLSR